MFLSTFHVISFSLHASAHGPALLSSFRTQCVFCRSFQVFAIVVFSCIESEGYINAPTSPQVKCIFNKNDSACHYAVGIGVIAFLACVGFLLLDVYLLFSSSAQERKLAVAADLGFSGLWTFLWFVCFCLLTSQWSRTEDMRGIPKDAAHAAIAFSFFSIATWVSWCTRAF
uniref:Synaptogyrin 2b n=2 Tax=Oryzias sinensis TaxID=183150 RepID=A0A8C7YCS1_9TELE